MKRTLFFLVLGLLLATTAKGQIKIGDNPQTIDPSSVLELESGSRVLVVTRVSTAEMNAITPLPGAVVYNTDLGCVHYYNGTEWINICEEVGGIPNLTTDPFINARSTVVITTDGENNHIEVAPNSIRTEQIVDGGINGDDIQDNSIGQNKIGNDAVGANELEENAVGVEALNNVEVETYLEDYFTNTVGYITSANILSTDPDNDLTDVDGAFYDEQPVLDAIQTNTDAIGLNSGEITTNANAISANTTDIATNAGNITANTSAISANTTAIGTKEDAANKSDDTTLGNSAVLFPTQNAVKTYVDNAAGAISTLNNEEIYVGNASNIATSVAMSGDATIDNTGAVTIENNAITTAKILNNAITTGKIRNSAVTEIKIADAAVTPIKIEPSPTNGRYLSTNASGVVEWVDLPAAAAEVDGIVGNEVTGPTDGTLTLAGGGTNANPLTLDVAAGGINTNELANGAVNTAKIADGTITTADLNNMGAAANQILKWNGTAWIPAADEIGTAVTPGVGLSLNGTDFDVDNLVGDVTGPTNATVIANNAVNSAKIADATILAEDLNQMGAADGQVLKWNNTTSLWEPAADAIGTGSAVTDTDANDGLTNFNATTGYNINVDDSTIELVADAIQIKDDGVTSAKIADATILAEDLNDMGAANNEVLKWNGTAWAPAADAGGTAYTAGAGLNLSSGAFGVNVDGTTIDVNGTDNLQVVDESITADKIANGTITAADLNDMGAAANQILKWNGTAWVPATDEIGTAVTPGIGLSLNGTDFDVDDLVGDVTGPTNATVIANNTVNSAKIADATILAEDLNQMGAAANQILKWNGTAWVPATDEIGTAVTPGIGLSLNGTDFDVDDLVGDVTGPTNATVIANNAVNSAKIADATILAEDLNQMGAAANQILKWNGTAWVPATDEIGTAATPGAGLSLNGTDFDVDDLVGDVTGPTNATVIANNAVNSAKIADATILAEDLNQMGAAANQILKWNGTAWIPAADEIGTAVTPGVGLSLNGTDFDVDNLVGDVTGPTNATVIANNAVNSAKIADATILAEDLNDMGAANNEVLKWNGTAWAPAADAGGTAYTAGAGLNLSSGAFGVNVDGTTIDVNGTDNLQVVDESITADKIANGTITAADLNDMGAAANQILKWNGTAWVPATDEIGTAVTPGIGLSLNGTDFDVDDLVGDVTGPTNATVIANNTVNSAKIADATILAEDLNDMGAANNEVLKWNGTAWAPAADAGGTAYTAGAGLNLSSGAFGVNVDGTTIDVNGTDNLQVVDESITADKIANGTITAADLNDMGAAANQILKWNGTAWVPATDEIGTAVTPGIGLSLNGTDFDVDDLVGDVTGPTNATVIANNTVNSAKIADATILAEDLNQMGAAANQILKWNGTAWVPATDEIGTAVTPGIGLSLNGTDFDVDDLVGDVTGPTNATVIANNAVNSAKIADATILNEDINGSAAIDGSKINPVFTSNVSTTGNLQVDGNVNVTGSHSPVPDYVFQKYFTNYSSLDPEYQFNDLQSVEKFIKINYHLPGVKSAAEIKEQGFWNLGETARINLEKIEELFLHTIEQEKKIDQLQNENKALNQELETLKSDIALIKQLLLTKEVNN